MGARSLGRASAAAAVVLLVALARQVGLEQVLRDFALYYLATRDVVVGVLLGWSAVACGAVALALRLRMLRRPVLPYAALAAAAVSLLVMVAVALADARAAARVNFAFVAGNPEATARLLVVGLLGLVLPAGLAAVLFFQQRLRARTPAAARAAY